jgi:hypothetical protein
MGDSVTIRVGFAELARYFARPEAHDVRSDDPSRTHISPAELRRAAEHLSPEGAAVAVALLAEPRDGYQALADLQREGWARDAQVSMRDLYAAARGTGSSGEPLGAAGERLYGLMQKRLATLRAMDQSTSIDAIRDPVWREAARGVDRYNGNNDGWLGIDLEGFARTDEVKSALSAIAHIELHPVTAEALTSEVGQGFDAANAVVTSYDKTRDYGPPVLEVDVDQIRDVTMRAYAREVAGRRLPLTFDASGAPTGALAAVRDAVELRTGGDVSQRDAWMMTRASATAHNDAITGYLATLSPSNLFDFTHNGTFAEALRDTTSLTRDDHREAQLSRSVSDVLILPNGDIEQRTKVDLDVFREHYPANLAGLRSAMARAGVDALPVAQIVALADARFRELQRRGQVGAVYDAHSMFGSVAPEGIRPLAVDPDHQRAIDAAFKRPTPTTASLSPVEREAVATGRLTLPEVGELRAIRVATQIFEQATPYGDDYGGWSGNVLSENFNELGQTNCVEEANTYAMFLQQLEDRGLLHHFSPSGRVRKATTHIDIKGAYVPKFAEMNWSTFHTGALLVRRAGGEYYVVDSWVENGGQPAHIVRLHDWLAGNYTASTVRAPTGR